MISLRTSKFRGWILSLILFAATILYGLSIRDNTSSHLGGQGGTLDQLPRYDEKKHNDLHMTAAECEAAFPDLTRETETVKANGPFDLVFRNHAVLQGKIEDGKLYILSALGKGDTASTMLHRQSATMHQIHRAVVTSPELLPNTSFAFGTHDNPVSDSLSYARPILSPTRKHIFPMPHFSFWSWPIAFIGSIPTARAAIAAIEDQLPFGEKDPRAVWRGTTWFNNGAGSRPRLRQDLVTAARGASWADVQSLDWKPGNEDAKNAIRIQDFCRYRYIIHTEGIGYSGRLQYHQLCASVILSPPLDWMQHTSHLIKPVFSSTLLGTSETSRFPTATERQAWPTEYPLDEANMVFVASDWSDLEATVSWLENHSDMAEAIAQRQRNTYHYQGYLSPAAEVCYWRALLRGWSEVAKPTGEEWARKGISAEDFLSGTEDRRV